MSFDWFVGDHVVRMDGPLCLWTLVLVWHAVGRYVRQECHFVLASVSLDLCAYVSRGLLVGKAAVSACDIVLVVVGRF